MSHPLRRLLAPLLAALLALAAAALLAVGVARTEQASAAPLGAPAAATYVTIEDRLMQPGTAAITTTAYSPSSLAGKDPRIINGWAGGDAFINADFATTGTLTATVQFSADGTNWATGVNTNASGTEVTLQEVITNDGDGMVHIPMAGQYVRFKLEPSASVTPTIRLVLRQPFDK